MSVASRISWLQSEIAHGRRCHITYSANVSTNAAKIRVRLEPLAAATFYDDGALLHNMLESIKTSASRYIAVDKGHCSKSTGCSEIIFYFTAHGSDLSPVNRVDESFELPPVPPPVEEPVPPLPPVPPPPLDVQVVLDPQAPEFVPESVQFNGHEATLTHIEHLCLHLNTNVQLLYPMQAKLEMLEHGILSQLSIVDRMIRRALNHKPHRLHDDEAVIGKIGELDNSITVMMASIQGDSSIPGVMATSCETNTVSFGTQVTARMIEEAIEELEFFGSEGASDEGMDELISVPEIQFSRDELYRRKVRVMENGAQMFGRIVELYIALSSQQPIFRVRFDDGDQQDFTREQVEAILM